MSFELSQYIELICDRRLDDALEYRKKNMPKKLYKYVSLTDTIICNKDENICNQTDNLNESKFKTLNDNRIWLSRFENLNDPFEYKSIYINYDKLKSKGWPTDMLENYLNRMKNIYLIGSFSTNLIDNMPMWAHYANNHQGFCIEYDVLNAKAIYPISYESERIGIASILTNIFGLVDRIYKGEINESNEDFQFYMTLITHFATVKHKSWSYENEYRVLQADFGENKFGDSISSISVGMIANRIFVGSRCSEDNKKRISQIAKDIKVDAYEMYLDTNESEYKLSYKRI